MRAASRGRPLTGRVDTDKYRLESVDRIAAVLSALEGDRSTAQAEVARIAGLTEATTLRYLTSLAAHGLVERDARTGQYRLGLQLVRLAREVLAGGDARRLALPFMEKLRAEFDETTNLAIRHNDDLILIESLESSHSIRRGASVGDLDIWHTSALGKSILALLPDAEMRQILGRNLPRFTPNTLTTLRELREDLATIRERGYAVDVEEAEADLCCVGAAIVNAEGRPTHALSVSGPTSRMTPKLRDAIGRELIVVARTVSERLGHVLPS